jgi:ATP-dependent helicase HrpA
VLLEPQSLVAGLSTCLRADRHRLAARLRAAESRLHRHQPSSEMLAVIADEIARSAEKRAKRLANLPKPTYPDPLPVVEKRQVIADAIAANQVIVLCGETGSGKTTQLPKICLDIGRGVDGFIGHTQPRRIAARSVATRIAQELNTPLGQAVGYKVRFGDHSLPTSYIKLMTDGILLAETQGDRLLEQYDTIIIDEAHERSLNIDFLLGYLHQLLPKRPDLKLIITSATIDPLRFSKHFHDAPIIEVSGRTYPVEMRYRPLISEDPEEEDIHQLDGIIGAVDELCREGPGDVLVFLAGEREIRETAEALRKHHPPATEILPLYARLSADEQMRVFQPHGRRRIVLATNVAETSLTVPGIRYVVDPGQARVSRYTPRTKVQRLPIEAISQASANQRSGRCGRVEAGICIRLYSQEDFASRPAFTEPEILRTNLASVILQMKAAHLGEIQNFPFVEPPDYQQIKDGYQTLLEIGAVDERHELTPIGKSLARLPIDPRLGRMILAASEEDCLAEVLVIAAALSVQDPRDRPMDKQDQADAAHGRFRDEGSDFVSFLKLWRFFQKQQDHLSHSKFRKMCRENFLSYTRLREWQDIYHQLNDTVGELGIKQSPWHGRPARDLRNGIGPNEERERPGRAARATNDQSTEDEFPIALRDSLHRALLPGLLANIGTKSDQAEYNGTRGTKFFLFPGSTLFSRKPNWVVAAELVETTRLYARTVGPIRPEWVERLATHLIHRTYFEPHWQPDTGHVAAYEKVTLYGLTLVARRLIHYGPIDPIRSRQLFIQHCLVEGDTRLDAPFFRQNRKLIEEVQSLEAKLRTRDVLVDEQVRYDFYDARIPADIYNVPLFEKWRKQAERDDPKLLHMTRRDLMLHGAEDATAERFPDSLEINGQRFALSYKLDSAAPDDGVTVTLPLPTLTKLPTEPFDWLVPGWLPEKITELMRTLPKPLRTKFVPIPDTARAVARAMPFAYGPLIDRLSQQLGKIAGTPISPRDFDQTDLPKNMRMNFRIIDDQNREVATGRDLQALRKQLGIAAAASFATLSTGQFHRDGLVRWDFGDLPPNIEVRRGEATLLGYPALVDQGESVSLRLLDSPEAQASSMRAGLRRLFMIQVASELKQLSRLIPDLDTLTLYYSTIGPAQQLKDDLVQAAADRAFFDGRSPMEIRTQEDFARRAAEGWRRLSTAMREIAQPVKAALAICADVNLRLQKPLPPAMADSVRDMTEQLRWLFAPHFILRTPWPWLTHLPRFARGIDVRLKKMLDAGLARDVTALTEVRPHWRKYVQQATADAEKGRRDPELETYRWMVEELRISLFAQELKTSLPISPKRLDAQWAKISR